MFVSRLRIKEVSQFIGAHCCSYPNDAKWCSVACVGRDTVGEEGFSDKGRLLMVGNSAGLPSAKGEGGTHPHG